MATNGKVKKINVVLKKRTESAPSPETKDWSMLSDFTRKVYSCTGSDIVNVAASSYSFEELYGAVTNACLQKLGPELYQLVKSQCAEQARRLVRVLTEAPDDARLYISRVQVTWNEFSAQLNLLRAVFSYLERNVCVNSGDRPVALVDLGVRLFGDELVRAQSVLGRTVSSLVSLVHAERDGETIDRSAVSTVVRMLASLDSSGSSPGGLYSSHVEPSLVAATDSYFAAEGAREMERQQPAQYMQHVDRRMKEEFQRCHTYLLPHTWKQVKAVLQTRLLADHSSLILERGFLPLVSSSRSSELGLMFGLLASVGRTDDMRRAYSEYCKGAAAQIVGKGDDEEKDKVLVQGLLDFRDAQDGLVQAAFGGSEPFLAAVKGAVEVAANSRENRPAELIAKYIDALLKDKGKGSGNDADMDAALDKVLALFRVVHGKDIFEAFYKKDLAKRLLLGRSASIDTEKAMIARLKSECGSAFTSKLEGMFKDVELSQELMAQYGAAQAGSAKDKDKAVDTFVHVLTASYWPTYALDPIRLPPEIVPAASSFDSFYLHKYNTNRRLAWVHGLGHCIVKATFPKGKHELDVSLHQAAVLSLFNSHDSLPFGRIKEDTGMPDGELRRTLQSLALGKARVLKKDTKGAEVADTDVFSFNEAFSDNRYRVKINQIQMKETKAEADATNERVMQDRQYQVDAAIVRIMKARKSLAHQALLTELFSQLRFPAKASDIKKRIESLIDREYLEKEGGGTDSSLTYQYLA